MSNAEERRADDRKSIVMEYRLAQHGSISSRRPKSPGMFVRPPSDSELVVVGMMLCVRISTQDLGDERTVLVGLAFLFKLFASFVRGVDEGAQLVQILLHVSKKWKVRRNTRRLVMA
jgi:hypothetical protein